MIKKNNRNVALIGGTGLVGRHLLHFLNEDSNIQSIKVLTRRTIAFNSSKIKSAKVDFSDIKSFQKELEGCNVIFCCVGTTNKKVNGNKEAYKKIDFDIPVNAAKIAEKIGCSHFIFISSFGANPKSSNFYLKLKGTSEEIIKKLHIPTILIFRPSFLIGKRSEFRFNEVLGLNLIKPLTFLLPSKMKPVLAKNVAKSMLIASKMKLLGFHIFYYEEIHQAIKAN